MALTFHMFSPNRNHLWAPPFSPLLAAPCHRSGAKAKPTTDHPHVGLALSGQWEQFVMNKDKNQAWWQGNKSANQHFSPQMSFWIWLSVPRGLIGSKNREAVCSIHSVWGTQPTRPELWAGQAEWVVKEDYLWSVPLTLSYQMTLSVNTASKHWSHSHHWASSGDCQNSRG